MSNPQKVCLAFTNDKEAQATLQAIKLNHLEMVMTVLPGGLKEAAHYLHNNKSPNILLLDISETELPLSEIYALGDACEPGVDVIVIGLKNDIGLYRQLVHIGIKDYIIKPLSETLLKKTIESVITKEDISFNETLTTNRAFSNLGKVISFVGTRGGIGTTTLAANCSWLMANTYFKKTSLIDMDTQLGMIAHLFDINTATGFHEVLEAPDRIDDIFTERVMVKQSDRLYVLSAEDNLNSPSFIAKDGVPILLTYLLTRFQYTVFDLPRCYTTPTTLELLRQADIVVIVTSLNILSTRDTVRIMKYLREGQNPGQRVIVVANHVNAYRDGEIHQKTFEEAIQCEIDVSIKFDAQAPLVALNKGTPVAQFKGVLSSGIQNLTAHILDRAVAKTILPQRSYKERFLEIIRQE